MTGIDGTWVYIYIMYRCLFYIQLTYEFDGTICFKVAEFDVFGIPDLHQ